MRRKAIVVRISCHARARAHTHTHTHTHTCIIPQVVVAALGMNGHGIEYHWQ